MYIWLPCLRHQNRSKSYIHTRRGGVGGGAQTQINKDGSLRNMWWLVSHNNKRTLMSFMYIPHSQILPPSWNLNELKLQMLLCMQIYLYEWSKDNKKIIFSSCQMTSFSIYAKSLYYHLQQGNRYNDDLCLRTPHTKEWMINHIDEKYKLFL